MKKMLCALLVGLMAWTLMPAGLAEAGAAAQPDATVSADTGADEDISADEDMGDDEDFIDEGTDEDFIDVGAEEDMGPNVAATRAADGTVTIDGQFTLVCPEALESIDVDQQDLEDGLLFSAYSETMGIDIYKYPQGEDTLESLYESFSADGTPDDASDDDMSEVQLATVGTVQVLVYRIDETGIDATLAGDTGFLYDIMFTYQTSDEYTQVGQMIASIKKVG